MSVTVALRKLLPRRRGNRTVDTLNALNTLAWLELAAEAMSIVCGLIVLSFARRVTPRLSLTSHRRTVQAVVGISVLIVISEFAAIVETLSHPTVLLDVVQEFAGLIAVLGGGCALYFVYKAERHEVFLLKRSAYTDELTGLRNRAIFRRAAARRVELSKSNDLPLACLLVDVDDFKSYNDRFGHEAGDRALRCVGRALGAAARADDLVARYGGEEFMVVVNADPETAAEVAERVRADVEAFCGPGQDPTIKRLLTVSIGVASMTGGTATLEELVEAADRQMYRAKRAGKNCVFDV